MSNQIVDASDLNAALNTLFEDFEDDVRKETKKAVDASTRKAVSFLRTKSPIKSGKYRSSWASKKDNEGLQEYSRRVYSKDRYMLTHLLELGHMNVRTGRRTPGIPHIEPAYNFAARDFESRMKG